MKPALLSAAAGFAAALCLAILPSAAQTISAPGVQINDAAIATQTTWSSNQINASIAAASAAANSPTLNGLVSGGGVINTTGLSFASAAASYYIGGSLYSATSQTVTLSSADPSNPRIDVIALDNTGTLIKVTGTASATPSVPTVDPSTTLPLTFVLVNAGATTPAGTTSEVVYSVGTGWTGSTSGSGWNLSSSTDPTIGATAIEVTSAGNGSYANFTRSSAESLGSGNLAIYIQSKAAWAGKRTLQLQFYNAAGAAVGGQVTLQSGAYGFDSSNTSSVQLVVIPLANFAIPSTTQVKSLRLTDQGGAIGFWINPIQIQTSTGTSSTGAPALTQAQADARYAPLTTVQGVAQTFVQDAPYNSLSNSTSYTVAFPQATAASGNTAFLIVSADGSQTVTPPAGWTVDINQAQATYARLMVLHKATAGETSATFTVSVNSNFGIYFFEMAGSHAIDKSATGGTANATYTIFPSITPSAGAIVFGMTAQVAASNSCASTAPTFTGSPYWKTVGAFLGTAPQCRMLMGHITTTPVQSAPIAPPELNNSGQALFTGGGIAYATFSIL